MMSKVLDTVADQQYTRLFTVDCRFGGSQLQPIIQTNYRQIKKSQANAIGAKGQI